MKYGTEPKMILKGHINKEKILVQIWVYWLLTWTVIKLRKMRILIMKIVITNSLNEYELYDPTLKLIKEAKR